MTRKFPRRLICGAVLWLCLIACGASVSSDPVRLLLVEVDPKNPERTEFGALTLLGAFELRSNHRQFGGISGLAIGTDGRLYAVTDRGHWLSARMDQNSDGRLLDLVDWQIKPLLTPEKVPTAGWWTDAEALARAPDGSFIVAFEQLHRIWRYPAPPLTLEGAALPLPAPPGLAQASGNGGLECATVLPDGTIFTVAEKFKNADGSYKGWLIDDGVFGEFSYTPAPAFHASDCVALANGNVIVLERSLSWLLSFSARLNLIEAGSIRPGAVLGGKELLRLDAPLQVDNFEGIAAQESPGGTLIYMISDDNFFGLQRTLLLQFRMPRPGD